MTESLLAALIGAAAGLAAATIPLWVTRRRYGLVAAADDVVDLLRSELGRLRAEAAEERQRRITLTETVEREQSQIHRLGWRVWRLEQALRQAGIDPQTINGPVVP